MKRMTREERASRMATIRRVLRYLRRYWPLMALSLALATRWTRSSVLGR